MGALSAAILNVLGLNIISGRKNTAANVRAVVGTIADAVATLEGLQRGASILSGAGVPANATGNDGDAYINTTVSDFYLKSNGTWGLRLVLRGNDGASAYQSWLKAGNVGSELAFVLSLRGQDGRSAYQSWQAAGNVGSEVQFVASLAGRSAYQSWQAAGNVGTEAQFVASLQAKQGDPGERGNRITANATAPNSGGVLGEAGDLEVIGAGTTFTDRIPGDLHFQTLSADRFRLWYQDRGTWVTLYTTPAGATVADGSITNEKLATDVKAGSIAVAKAAYPQADRAGFNSISDFLVWIGPKITDLFSRVGSLDTAFGTLSSLVNGFAGRISALEARPVGGTSTGTGGSGTANYPAQSGATTGLFLQSTGATGSERWATPVNNRVGWIFSPKNELSRTQRFFKQSTINRIQKDAGISTLSYSINGATAVQLVFTANVFTPPVATPLVFPAGALITWSLTYAAGQSEGAFEVEATETIA